MQNLALKGRENLVNVHSHDIQLMWGLSDSFNAYTRESSVSMGTERLLQCL